MPNVYLPKDLDEKVRALDVNVSAVCQEALRQIVEATTQTCSRCNQTLPEGWRDD
jgi:post-segregation antitoxin (ccd killing protein)